jgi:hypothetical protein
MARQERIGRNSLIYTVLRKAGHDSDFRIPMQERHLRRTGFCLENIALALPD